MKKYLSLVLAVASLLALVGQVSARTVHIQVTPENIQKQNPRFTVKVKDEGQFIEFAITIGSVGLVDLNVPTPVTMVKSERGQTYTFRVAHKELDTRAQFIYTETLQDWMHPFAGPGDYWVFRLKDFVGNLKPQKK
jgi:hypothetical protein